MFIEIDDEDLRRDIETMKTSIPAAALLAGQAATRELASKLRDRVKAMIPDGGGWYDIYRDAIRLTEINPDLYEVSASVSAMEFGKIDAATSLIWLTGGDTVSQALSQYNPWTLDTIPAIKKGMTCELMVRPASESEANFWRRKRLSERGKVELLIRRVGETVDPVAEMPKINGRVMADVPFLALRLEHGLGGFPRIPIWSRLDDEGNIIAKSKSVSDAGHNVFSDRWRG